ncbi:transposase [Cohnella thailandensis]|uniref:Transposase n=1 Tax=Cohnella thailandensis TaxID=557557 RepID=A0A841SLW1_9BACL|nr:transposase [Cohnella thailandensis]MBB6633473.1 transposase [Cohnella thailandensis]MBP1974490.1 transposase-like protein [Cohnella thailandensis]
MAETRRRRFTPKQKAHIVSRLLEENSTVQQVAAEFDIHPILLQRWKSHALANLSKLFEKESKETEKLKADYELRIEELRQEANKLTLQLEWLKKVAAASVPKQKLNELVRREEQGLPIRTQTELLGLSRSTLYYRLNHPSAQVFSVRQVKRSRPGELHPALLPAGLNVEEIKQYSEFDLAKLRIQNGLMDVFGGFH